MTMRAPMGGGSAGSGGGGGVGGVGGGEGGEGGVGVKQILKPPPTFELSEAQLRAEAFTPSGPIVPE